MRRLILALLAGMLLACSSGCRVVPNRLHCDRLFNSVADCWQANVRRPADWCWGNCPVPQQPDDGLKIERLKGVDEK